MDDWLSAIEDELHELIDNNERGGPSNNVEEEAELVGVASDGHAYRKTFISRVKTVTQNFSKKQFFSQIFFIFHFSLVFGLLMINTLSHNNAKSS